MKKTHKEHGDTWRAQKELHEAKHLSFLPHTTTLFIPSLCFHTSLFPLFPLLDNTNGTFSQNTEKGGGKSVTQWGSYENCFATSENL